METKEPIDAKTYIDLKYEQYSFDDDRSAIPQTLLDAFDMKAFCYNCMSRDIHNVLVNSEPLEEFERFYECLDSDRNKTTIKSFTFDKMKAIRDKYNQVYEAMELYGKEIDETLPVGEPKDSSDFEILVCIDMQYETEAKRILKIAEELTSTCSSIISSIDEMSDEELDQKQVEILILLEDAKDKSKIDPEKLLRASSLIYRQLNFFKIDDKAVEKLNSQYE